MNNYFNLEVKKLKDVKILIIYKYGSIRNFCDEVGISELSIFPVLNNKNHSFKHIKKICSSLSINWEGVEEWRNL